MKAIGHVRQGLPDWPWRWFSRPLDHSAIWLMYDLTGHHRFPEQWRVPSDERHSVDRLYGLGSKLQDLLGSVRPRGGNSLTATV